MGGIERTDGFNLRTNNRVWSRWRRINGERTIKATARREFLLFASPEPRRFWSVRTTNGARNHCVGPKKISENRLDVRGGGDDATGEIARFSIYLLGMRKTTTITAAARAKYARANAIIIRRAGDMIAAAACRVYRPFMVRSGDGRPTRRRPRPKS